MHPTPEEQLRAIGRLVDGAAAVAEDVAASQAMLSEAGRLVRRLERSWSARLPFLIRDNELAAALLVEMSPSLDSLRAEIDAIVGSLPRTDEPTAHSTNKALQDLLARAVHDLPDDPTGDRARDQIVAHLRSRLAADPSINRSPADHDR